MALTYTVFFKCLCTPIYAMTESENGKTLEENTKTTNTEPMAEFMFYFLVTWIVGLTIFPFGS